MLCPICKNVNLVMSERLSIEIDYCPQCRGVWLDRGELDKMIEKSTSPSTPVQSGYIQQQAAANYGHHNHSHGGHYKKKREGFLSELFDFD